MHIGGSCGHGFELPGVPQRSFARYPSKALRDGVMGDKRLPGEDEGLA